MGRQKAVAKDLLANIPDSVDAQSAPTQPKPKTKRIKKAQPKAIQHAHSFSVQSFENQNELADKKRETLEDQAEATIKAQNDAEEKAESAEAIRKVLEAQKKEAEEKMSQAQKELQDALATKEAEVKAADEKGYNEGVADVAADYEKQVK
ncbi:plectin-like [Camellia sinensis]|uniref:plectin-like n=1 Tax=Camellia sinensis TaxID=4442 RepID=UPI00103699EE|nr:plectin-like [Camellia sinensis]